MSTSTTLSSSLYLDMPTLSPNSHGAAVNICNWFLLVATLLTVITRTAMKWFVARKTNIDDAVILLASIFAIGESIAISCQVSSGLGQHLAHLTASQQLEFQKSYYAGVLLYLPCISLSKVAVLSLLRTITPVVAHRRILYTTGVITIVWAGVAEVVLAFQCRLPHAWAILEGQCINLSAFWYWFGITQLLLDAILVLLPWVIVRHVQISTHRKAVIVCCFGTRLTVVVATIAQLTYFNSAISSNDVSFHLWSEVVCTQVVQSLNVITACVPHLKPFFDSLESGMIRSDDLRWRRGPDSPYTPSRSIQSPNVLLPRHSRSAAAMAPEILELDGGSKDSPVSAVSNVEKTGHAAFHLERPAPVARSSTRSPPQDPPLDRKATDPGPDGDSDSQTSRSGIIRKMRLPSRARESRARI
ncbi:MAG: hypothetical protein Q9224_004804 [Gallowayella concinna]